MPKQIERSLQLAPPGKGVWLSFSPVYEDDDEIVHHFRLHMVNETERSYFFRYRQLVDRLPVITLQNELLVSTPFYLHDILFEQLNDNPHFEAVFTLKQPDPAFESEYRKVLKPKARQIFRELEAVRRDGAFFFLWFDQYPSRAADEFENMDFGTARHHDQHTYQHDETVLPKYEVDLHIEKLLDDPGGLGNFEILLIQLRTFQQYLDLAIAHRQPSMIAIHGIGKGKLRDDIHEILRRTAEVSTFVNQYDPRYGFGATEIFFKYR